MTKKKIDKKLLALGLTSVGMLGVSGTALASDAEVESATNGIPATNNPDDKGVETPEFLDGINNTGKSNGSLELDIDTKNRDDALDKLKAVGGTATKGQDEDLGVVETTEDYDKVLATIKVKLDKQTEDITKLVNEWSANSKSRLDEIKRIEDENKRLQEEHDRLVRELEQKNNEIDEWNKGVSARNKAKLDDYKRALDEYNKLMASVKIRLDEYRDKVTMVQQDLADIDANGGDGQNELASGYWQNLKTKTLDGDIIVGGRGIINSLADLSNGNYTLHAYSKTDGKINDGNIISAIRWVNGGLESYNGSDVRQGNVLAGLYGGKFYDVYTGGTTQIYSVRSNEWFKVPAAITMKDGTTQDLLVRLSSTMDDKDNGGDWWTVWNAGNSLNYYKRVNNIKIDFKLVSGEKVLWTSAMTDLDYGQFIDILSDNTQILGYGGGTRLQGMSGTRIKSNDELGWSYGKNATLKGSGLVGPTSIPDGTYTYVGFTDMLSYRISNSSSSPARSAGIANADFGIDIYTNYVSIPKFLEPTKPTPPEEEKEKPKLPNNIPPFVPKELPKELTPPTYTYINYKVGVKPGIIKNVKNMDNEDINDRFVPKMSNVKWELVTKPILKGREETTSYVIEDNLPQGYILDLAATKAANNHFEVSYDSTKHKVVLTGKRSLLDIVNANRAIDVTPPAPVLIGKVINDAAVYENTFKLIINDVDIVSNIVKVRTPGKENPIKPIKHNYDDNGVIIDGKALAPGSINNYGLLWDLDQYKDMKASKEDILKGFAMIDDYPEEALDLVPNGVKITDINGNVVNGISVFNFANIEEAKKNDKVCALLETSTISPKGAFQVFLADDPVDFYNKYVVEGTSLNILTKMVIKDVINKNGGKYENTAYQVDFGNGYSTDIVVNNVPKVEPHKNNYNTAGVLINGKTVAPETINMYTLNWNLANYKGMSASEDLIKKGFYMIDDYPEEALDILDGTAKVYLGEEEISGITVLQYNSLEEAPTELQELIRKNGLTLKGAFQVVKADDALDFFNKYVVTGKDLKVVTPMKIKSIYNKTGVEYENTAYQMDFGYAQITETIQNNVIVPDPKKHNYDKGGALIDGKLLPIGATNYYRLTWSLSKLKNMVVDEDMLVKGFYMIDDYPEEALDVLKDDVRVLDNQGNIVNGIKVHYYTSVEEAPEKIRDLIAKNGIKLNGAYQVFDVEDAKDFYEKYVKQGIDLTVESPMVIKKTIPVEMYKNKAYEIDLGIAYETEEIENKVKKPKPTKHNYNNDGTLIDDKVVPVGTINNYEITWNLSNFKDIVVSDDLLAKGFFMVDDYPEDIVEVLEDRVKVVDEQGNLVDNVEINYYERLEDAPEDLRKLLEENGIKVKGAFQVVRAKDVKNFYEDYVVKGIDLKVLAPMQVKAEIIKGETKYDNVAYEIDFGIGYAADPVKNKVDLPDPKKHNYNDDGVLIDGKQVLAGSINNYKLTWDLDQYKDIEASKDEIAKGFFYVDDYPEEALDLVDNGVNIVDVNGNKVSGITVVSYEDIAFAPNEVLDMLRKAGVRPKGAFQLFTVDDPVAFYEKYVKTGTNLEITTRMRVKDVLGVAGGKYENTAYQIDFGRGFATEVIVNNVPKLNPKKDVVVEVGGASIDNATIELGQVFNYHLVGSLIEKDRSHKVDNYTFSDDYDEIHDEYSGQYKVYATVDLELIDGTIIKAGTDITEYTVQEYSGGKVKVDLKRDFLHKIALDSQVQFDVYLQMTRIKAGEVENTYVNNINGVDYKSNTVKTRTPEKQQPPIKQLPKTGIADSSSTLLGMFVGLLAILGIRRKVK